MSCPANSHWCIRHRPTPPFGPPCNEPPPDRLRRDYIDELLMTCNLPGGHAGPHATWGPGMKRAEW